MEQKIVFEQSQRLCVAVLSTLSHIVLPGSVPARRTGDNLMRVISLPMFLECAVTTAMERGEQNKLLAVGCLPGFENEWSQRLCRAGSISR